jgi:hypothetical protein
MERSRDRLLPRRGVVSPRGLALTAFGVAIVLVLTAVVIGGLGSNSGAAGITDVGADPDAGPDGDGGAGTAGSSEPDSPPRTAETPTEAAPETETADGTAPVTATPSPSERSTTTPTPTPTPAPGSSSSGSGADGGDSTAGAGTDSSDGEGEAHFVISVQQVEECGQRCRDVTAAVENDGTATAENVTVEARVLATGDELWRGDATIGDLPAGETATRTKRVTIGIFDAAKIQANNGYVTIELTVRWDGGEDTVTERRQVT